MGSSNRSAGWSPPRRVGRVEGHLGGDLPPARSSDCSGQVSARGIQDRRRRPAEWCCILPWCMAPETRQHPFPRQHARRPRNTPPRQTTRHHICKHSLHGCPAQHSQPRVKPGPAPSGGWAGTQVSRRPRQRPWRHQPPGLRWAGWQEWPCPPPWQPAGGWALRPSPAAPRTPLVRCLLTSSLWGLPGSRPCQDPRGPQGGGCAAQAGAVAARKSAGTGCCWSACSGMQGRQPTPAGHWNQHDHCCCCPGCLCFPGVCLAWPQSCHTNIPCAPW